MSARRDGRSFLVDLYELTMAQAYLSEGLTDPAVFELSCRDLPPQRRYLLTAGLADALDALADLRFDTDDLAYLRSLDLFDEGFLERLGGLRFTGDVDAMPEGTVALPGEPLLQVTAPLPEAQLAETVLLNRLHAATSPASKAARVVQAADGRPVVDFGARRTLGHDAADALARSTWIAGGAGTSNVAAGRRYGIPVFGTMAHSYVQAHDDEAEALRRFQAEFPGTTLLVDTHDTLDGVRAVVRLARASGDDVRIGAVRLDSGDLHGLAVATRRLLDAGGLTEVRILASGGLDEHRIADLLARGAPLDGFGVGSRLAVSADAPDLDLVYKLTVARGRPRLKTSTGKATLPGRKQVFRRLRDGRLHEDVLGLHGERLDGEPLLVPVMRRGERLPQADPPLAAVRDRAREQLALLPDDLRALSGGEKPADRVSLSATLAVTRDRALREVEAARARAAEAEA